MQSEIPSRVRAVLAEHYGKDLPYILDAARLTEDLGGDDITRIGMACALEVEFGVAVDDDDIVRWQHVIDVIQFVQRSRAR